MVIENKKSDRLKQVQFRMPQEVFEKFKALIQIDKIGFTDFFNEIAVAYLNDNYEYTKLVDKATRYSGEFCEKSDRLKQVQFRMPINIHTALRKELIGIEYSMADLFNDAAIAYLEERLAFEESVVDIIKKK